MVVAGIDPGISGALAFLTDEGDCETMLMPVMGKPKVVNGAVVARWLREYNTDLVVIERAQAMPGQGSVSMFRYGQSYGQVLGAIQTSLIPHVTVTAKRWKGEMHLSPDKAESIRRAVELMPRHIDQFTPLKKYEARAEAALIAWWYLYERTTPKQEERL